MTAPSATVTKVKRRLDDLSSTNPQVPDSTILDEAIESAVSRYSLDRPRELTADVTGLGTAYLPLTGGSAVLASWSDGFSQIRSVDYPAGAVAVNYTPTWLDSDLDWTLYNSASVKYLRFTSAQPAVSEKVRITYTAPHTHTTVLDTVPPTDLDALCDLAASYACQALATKAAGSQDSVIQADSTNYRDAQLRYKQQAEAWFASYEQRMNLTTGKAAGASANADWNRPSSVGWPQLTHSRRWR